MMMPLSAEPPAIDTAPPRPWRHVVERMLAAFTVAALTATAWLPAGARAQVTGPPEAAVTIMVFSAFTCPYCGQGREQLDALMQKYPGKVRVIFKHFPLSNDESDLWPHLVAAAAGEQGRFQQAHDALFSRPPLRKRATPGAALQLAALGIDYARMMVAIDSGVAARRVSDDQAEAAALKIRASPHILCGWYASRWTAGFRHARASRELSRRGR